MINGDTSVIIPCHNGEKHLAEAVESVRQQTFAVREIIIVDDGSDIPVSAPSNWDGPPLRIVRTPNRRAGAARNTGLAHTTAEFVAFLDADDLWHPRKVEAQTNSLTANPKAVASYTRCENKPGFFGFGPYPPLDVSDDEFLLVLWYNLFFPPSAVAVRADVLRALGGFREDLGNGEDIELWLRLLTRGSFVQVPEPLTGYRQHGQQFTKNIAKKIFGSKEARRAMIDQHGEMLVRAGLARERLWDSYRNDILLVYFRRDLAAARRLLWDYWHEHPRDWKLLKYALISLLPGWLVSFFRSGIPERVQTPCLSSAFADDPRWAIAWQRIQQVLAHQGVVDNKKIVK